MAIQLVGVGTKVFESSVTTVEVPLHASTADGHFVICFAGVDDNVALTCPESGVTEQDDQQLQTPGGDRGFACYTKVASSEPANWTVNVTPGTPETLRAVAITLSGVDPTTPIDAAIQNNSNSNADTHATPAITTVTPNAWVFSAIYGVQTSTATGSRTAPSGYTEDCDDGGLSFLLVAHKSVASPGTETPGTWGNMSSTADQIGYTIAIRPVLAGGTGLFRGLGRGIGRGIT